MKKSKLSVVYIVMSVCVNCANMRTKKNLVGSEQRGRRVRDLPINFTSCTYVFHYVHCLSLNTRMHTYIFNIGIYEIYMSI